MTAGERRLPDRRVVRDRDTGRGVRHHLLEERPGVIDMTDEMTPLTAAEGRSLDIVQRTLISMMILLNMGILSAALAAYLVLADEPLPRTSVVGLWIMTGVIGLLCVAVMLVINRRRPYHPLVLLGLVPMIVSWFWIFG